MTDAQGTVFLGALGGIAALCAFTAAPLHSGTPPELVFWLLDPNSGPPKGLPLTLNAVYKPGGEIFLPYPLSSM